MAMRNDVGSHCKFANRRIPTLLLVVVLLSRLRKVKWSLILQRILSSPQPFPSLECAFVGHLDIIASSRIATSVMDTWSQRAVISSLKRLDDGRRPWHSRGVWLLSFVWDGSQISLSEP